MKTLPIGSVILLHNTKLMIIGHFIKDKETKNESYYVTVPYPLGYINKDKTICVAINEEFEVLHTGYMNDRCTTYTTQLDKVLHLSNEEFAIYGRLGLEAMKTVE